LETAESPKFVLKLPVPDRGCQHFGRLSASQKFMKNWYTYVLLCDQKTFYVGITNNIPGRLLLHKNKESFFTKKFSDFKLVYCEKYKNKYEAAEREKQIKGWSRAKKQMLIDGKLGINRIEPDEVLAWAG
jgi:putative endonuclease